MKIKVQILTENMDMLPDKTEMKQHAIKTCHKYHCTRYCSCEQRATPNKLPETPSVQNQKPSYSVY